MSRWIAAMAFMVMAGEARKARLPRPLVALCLCLVTSLAMLGLAGLHAPAKAEARHVKVVTKFVYYDIQGTTAQELYDSMDVHGPALDPQGKYRAIGLASARFDWDMRCVCKGQKCVLKIDSFRLKETIVLPRWEPPRGVSPTLVFTWNSFVKMVKKHELTHRAVDTRIAKELLRALKLIKPKSSCNRMSRAVDKVYKKKYSERLGKSHERFHKEFYINANRNPIQLKD